MAEDENKVNPVEKTPVETEEPKKVVDLDLDEDLANALGEPNTTDNGDVNFDQVIAEADPNFKEEIASIDAADFVGVDIQTDSKDVTADVENEKVPSAFRAYLSNLPKDVKTRYLVAVGVLVTMLPLSLLIFNGFLMPRFDLPYYVSMNELTESVYTYPVDTVEVPLFDEFKSQSVTYPLPKTSITLKKVGDVPAYGQFEFFLNLREKEMMDQIKVKESEIIDLIQRSLEQVTWDELQTPVGKERVKKLIRHRVNEYLQSNVILGVYYRSVILSK